MAGSSHQFAVGDRVRVNVKANQQEGIVRWSGFDPDFATGAFIGIELPGPTGKNDGKSKDIRYFECKPNHGMFVRPGQAVLLERAPGARPAPGPGRSRPQSMQMSRPPSALSSDHPSAPTSRPVSVLGGQRPSVARQGSSLSATSGPSAGGPASRSSPPQARPAAVARLNRAGPPASSSSSTSTPTISNILHESAEDSPASTSSVNDTPTPAARAFVPRHGRKPSAPLVPSFRAGDSEGGRGAAAQEDEQGVAQNLHRTLSASSAASSVLSGGGPGARSRGLSGSRPGSRTEATPSGEGTGMGISGRHRQSSSRDLLMKIAQDGPPDVFGPTAGGGTAGLSRRPSQQSLAQSEHSAAGENQPAPRARLPGLGADSAEAREAARESQREIMQLRIKVQTMERKRSEDAERMRLLEEKGAEADNFLAARAKLTAKFTELNKDLADLRRQKKEFDAEKATFEARETELTEQLEMSTLDKETAEETAELLQHELTELKEECQLLKDEINLFKEENALYDKAPESADESSPHAMRMLETHNARLREALEKLRDISVTNEKESKQRVTELEKELAGTEDLAARLEEATVKLEAADLNIENLMQQVDNLIGSEEMMEQMTERQIAMNEEMEGLRVQVEELSTLKDINEELEENHIETEKEQFQEIEQLHTLLREEMQKVDILTEALADKENTIVQFRDMVQDQQQEIDDLQVAHDDEQSKTAHLTSQQQTALNANLRLHTTLVKEQSRLIDTELSKMIAGLAIEHLKMLQTFIPEQYIAKDEAATDSFLYLQRITWKSQILLSAFCQIYNIPDTLQEAKDERLVGICELRGQITQVANSIKRFASVMGRSTPEEYLNLAGAVPDLRAIEPRLDDWLGALRRDEFSEQDCAMGLNSIMEQVEHFGNTVFSRDDLDLPERQLGLAQTFDCDLDNFAAAIGYARAVTLALAGDQDTTVIESEGITLEEAVYEPVQRILNQVRGVKASSMKLVHHLEELQQQGASLKTDVHVPLRMLADSVANATDLANSLAHDVRGHIEDLRESHQPLRIANVLQLLRSVTASVPGGGDTDPWDIIGMYITRLGNDIHQLLPTIKMAMDSHNLDPFTGEAPWILRSQAVRREAATNSDAEMKVVKQAEEITDLVRQIRLRDQSLEETQVKAEVQRRKADEAIKSAESLAETKQALDKAQKAEKTLKESLAALQVEWEVLEKENARLRVAQGGVAMDKSTPSRASKVGSSFLDGGASGSMDGAQAYGQIESLRSAVRYLRHENAQLKAEGLLGDLRSLPALSHRSSTPDLIRARPGSPTSSSDDSPLTPPPFIAAQKTTLQPFVERKLLWRELAHFQASAEVVDLTKIKPGRGWKPVRTLPEVQLKERAREEERLKKRAREFVDRSLVIKASRV